MSDVPSPAQFAHVLRGGVLVGARRREPYRPSLVSSIASAPFGKALNVNQPAVAKLERRTDMYVSNLRAYIEAFGGKHRRAVPTRGGGYSELL